MPQIDPQQVVKDPNFLGLPPQEQMKVLARIDPNYAALPPAEQSRVIGTLVAPRPKVPGIPLPPAVREMAGTGGPPAQPSLVGGFLSELKKNAAGLLPTWQQAPSIIGGMIGSAAEPGLGTVIGAGAGELLSQAISPPKTATEGATRAISNIGPGALEGLAAQRALGAGTSAAEQGILVARNKIAGGTPRFIEQRILGGSSSAERRALAGRLAPELAQDPAFAKALTQEQFDKAAVNSMKTARTAMDLAEAAVPKGITVPKAQVLADIRHLEDQFQVPAQMLKQQVPVYTPGKGLTGFTTKKVRQSITINPDALAALSDLREEVRKFPKDIPWEDLRNLRQKLDKNIELKGGFKETASAAERAKIIAERDVANSIRGHLANALPQGPIQDQMLLANKLYSRASDLGLATGMDWQLGRRLSAIGVPTFGQRAVQRLPWAIGGGTAALAGEEFLRRHFGGH